MAVDKAMSMFTDRRKHSRKRQERSPLVEPHRTVPSHTSFSAEQRTRRRLLLIEDHEGLAEATAEFIRGEGLEVQVVYCGRDALEAARTFQPEIVVCDMSLPDMTGLDVARALRVSLAGARGFIIAICTAMTDADLLELERSGQALAVNLFLSKPITPEKLDTLLSASNSSRLAASNKTR
jgi:CheY-like chemotaxis protein